MRTLDKNKTKLWVVNSSGTTEMIDSDGFYTGEVVKSYGVPSTIYLHLYPSGGEITEKLFGKDSSFDMLAVSNNVILTKDSLLFLDEPLSNYDITYDYRVSEILKSLNTYNYGLKKRE